MSDRNMRVLVIGIVPELVDLSSFPELTPDRIRDGIEGQVEELTRNGYPAVACWIDLGETAEAVVAEHLAHDVYACVVIGAGIRVMPAYFLLFEKLVNLVHARAPQAKLCFNTNPTDTTAAVQRWL